MRGTVVFPLSVRARICGKPNCKCQKGEKHVDLFLVMSKGGKVEQLYIPREKEETVRQQVTESLNLVGLTCWLRGDRKSVV